MTVFVLLSPGEGMSLAGGAARSNSADLFLSSSFCQQYTCINLGVVQLTSDREIRIYTTTDVELRLYTLVGEVVGAEYVFPLNDTWDERAENVAAFFSEALRTRLSSTKVKQFAENPSSRATRFTDGRRRFLLSLEATHTPGLPEQRMLHVEYGRDFIAESQQ